MAIQTTTFKGARYLVKFDGDWDQSKSYEAITSVQNEGFTYISKQPVPAGVSIDNADFWLLWADPNAQMEQLRQLVSEYVDDIAKLEQTVSDFGSDIKTLEQTVSDHGSDIEALEQTVSDLGSDVEGIKKTNVGIIDVVELGVDNTGATDVTASLQAIVDDAKAGDKVIFPYGSYLINGLNLKSGIEYDFCNSTLLFDSGECLKAYGTLKATVALADNYIAGTNYIPLQMAPSYEPGDIVIVSNQTRLAIETRAYYHKGFVSLAGDYLNGKLYVPDTCPYNIEADGAVVNIYAPANVIIENIGNIEYVGNAYTSDNYFGVQLMYNAFSIIKNCKTSDGLPHVYLPQFCYGTVFENCTHNVTDESVITAANPNPYFIAIGCCTNTIIRNCAGTNVWHMVTTGGAKAGEDNVTVLNTTIENCSFSCAGTHIAIADHENTYNTKVVNCRANAIVLAQNGTIDGCDIYSDGIMQVLIQFTGKSRNQSMPNICTVKDTHVHNTANTENAAVWFVTSARSFPGSSNDYQYDDIVFENVTFDNPTFAEFGNRMFFTNKIVFNGCTNIYGVKEWVATGASCIFSNCMFNGFNSNYPVFDLKFAKTIFENCMFNLTGLTFDCKIQSNLNYAVYFTNCNINHNEHFTVENLATGAHYYFENVNSNQNVSTVPTFSNGGVSGTNKGYVFLNNSELSTKNLMYTQEAYVNNCRLNKQRINVIMASYDGTIRPLLLTNVFTTGSATVSVAPFTGDF